MASIVRGLDKLQVYFYCFVSDFVTLVCACPADRLFLCMRGWSRHMILDYINTGTIASQVTQSGNEILHY